MMAYCKKCGSHIEDNAIFCPECGADQGLNSSQGNSGSQSVDNGSFGWGVLGFCIPIVGLILFLVWHDSKPKSGKQAGIGALVSVILGVVFYILAFALGMAGAMLG